MREYEAFSFTPEDLSSNSSGRITPGQVKRLQELRRHSRKGYIISGFVFFFTVALFTGIALERGGVKSDQFFFTALSGVIFFLIYGFFAVLALIRTRDTRTGRISAAEGKLEVKSTRNRCGTIFTAKVGGTGFRLTHKAQFDSLKDHSYCKIYYVKNPPVHLILSVELMG